MNNIEEVIGWITQRRATRENKIKALSFFTDDHPLFRQKIIHVAGTNGKGSTVSMLSECLMSASYSVGTLTSPHLIKHQDRIRIDGKWIDDDSFYRIFMDNYDRYLEYDLNMFEMDLDIAAHYFEDNKVDFVILEVGLGGRMDSTNVIKDSLASVIVSIGFDHMSALGDTLGEIAYEKAGIIKENGLVICGEHNSESVTVIKEVAQKKNARFILTEDYETVDKLSFKYKGNVYSLNDVASYQIHNATVVIETLTTLNENNVLDISVSNIQEGLKRFRWAGRFDVISKDPLIIVDGAHNKPGVIALIDSLKDVKRPLYGIFGCVKDKDYDEMINLLNLHCDELVLCEFDFYRSMKIDDFNNDLVKFKDYQSALAYINNKDKQGTIIITGSLYFISEVLLTYQNGK